MSHSTIIHVGRRSLREAQDQRLHAMLQELDGANPFYTAKLRAAGLRGERCTRADFHATFPFTTKAELVEDQRRHPPFGSNLTYPLARYTRYSQTSGTTGAALRWLDTNESWGWMLDNWARIYGAAGVSAADRVFTAFSFGPFLGFWTAFEAAVRIGCLALPGGGMSSTGRLAAMRDIGATVLCCTPTYAIRLGEVAAAEGAAIAGLRRLIVAGEPGGSIPAVRARLAALWPGATVIDHHGMTEIGPVSFQYPQVADALFVHEVAFIAEIIDPLTRLPVPAGSVGELVLTNLGRWGSPLLRYRTGDLVRAAANQHQAPGCVDLALEGGILGRSDDLVIVRGVNVHPSAVEAVVRAFPEVREYRVRVRNERGMAELALEIEVAAPANGASVAAVVADALRAALSLRVPVTATATGTLPVFEMKAKRWVRE